MHGFHAAVERTLVEDFHTFHMVFLKKRLDFARKSVKMWKTFCGISDIRVFSTYGANVENEPENMENSWKVYEFSIFECR